MPANIRTVADSLAGRNMMYVLDDAVPVCVDGVQLQPVSSVWLTVIPFVVRKFPHPVGCVGFRTDETLYAPVVLVASDDARNV